MRLVFFCSVGLVVIGCSANSPSLLSDDDETTTGAGAKGGAGGVEGTTSSGDGGEGGLGLGTGGGSGCVLGCSPDFKEILDCKGNTIEACSGKTACDPSSLTCQDACTVAAQNKQSVGCEYYATDMESYQSGYCFAAFIANTWQTPVKIQVERGGQVLPVASFARIPNGQGPALTYAPYDEANGLPPGQVAILFLAGSPGGAPNCPVAAAVSGDAGMSGTGVGTSFRVTTDVPVVAYQMNPYGGGSTAVTSASLLIPTSAWDTNYVAMNAYGYDLANPSMNIVAMEDNTTVTMVPVAPVTGGGGVPSSPANQQMAFTLFKGQNAQISQQAELTGSIIQSDKPIGLMAGQPCMRTPKGVAYCDHGEQMVPPVQALGSEYVSVMYRPRSGEPAIYRFIGAVDGTQLTYSSNVGGPPSLNQGQIVEVITGEPFVVKSQDDEHPFLLFTYMSGSQWTMLADKGGYGDVEFVLNVPPQQYMANYVFFTDPTYPETNLVVVRSKLNDKFHDVTLDCAGVLGNWQPVGDYEWTRVDLITGDFQNVGNCSTGRHEMKSDAPFGLWVWGWGTPLTSTFTANVSYGYPAGMNIRQINDIVIIPAPK